MVENGRKQKEHIYDGLLYILIAIFSNIIKIVNLFICKTLIYILIWLLSCLK